MALIQQEADVLAVGLDAAHRRTDQHGDPFRRLRRVQLRRRDRLSCRDDGELRRTVHPPVLLAAEDGWVESFDFSSKRRREVRCVKARDRRDSGLTGDQGGPGGRQVETKRGDRAHAGYDDAPAGCPGLPGWVHAADSLAYREVGTVLAAPKMSDTLCPPNPIEFDIATVA